VPEEEENVRPVLKARQAADIKVAMGRTLEKRGDLEGAQAAYLEALRQDPNRADACARLAVLYDRQGKFARSAELYRLAHDLQGDSPSLCCNQGYSFYLQRRWADAEASLRRAIALGPAEPRAHNNLGLTLAHAGRPDEALAEFRKAGCNETEAEINLALALATEGSWVEARAHYEQALTADPSSARARKGLRDLDSLTAKAATATAALPCPPADER
jgi:Flp pilus assembly protein TadD